MRTTPITAKVYLPDNEIRKFSAHDKTLEDFKSLMKEGGIDANEIKLEYQNDKQEWVPFRSETEWNDVLSNMFSSLLRIRVVVPPNVKITKPMPVIRSLNSCSISYAQYTQNLPADLFDFHQV